MRLGRWVLFLAVFVAMFSIWLFCQPTDIIDVPIAIKGNVVQGVQAFGLDLVFNPAVYEYQSIERGSLTQDWAQVDGNLVEPGRVRIGGYYGSGTVVTGSVDGTMAVVRLRFINGEVALENFVDDIRNMELESTAVVSIGGN